MNKPLEVDAFPIDLKTLATANECGGTPNHNLDIRLARWDIVCEVTKNLALDDKKRFEEYQEQNDPCR